MANLFQTGGVAGSSASFTVDDAGALTVTDSSGATILALSSAGVITQKGALTPAAGGTAIIDATNCATGEADIVVADNKADALTIRNGSTSVFTVTTTDNGDKATLSTLIIGKAQVIDMNDTTHTLVFGSAAGANQTLLSGNVLLVDPNSGGASEILKLPATTGLSGLILHIFNVGGESIVVQTAAGGSVGGGVTITSGGFAVVGTDGTSWGGKAV